MLSFLLRKSTGVFLLTLLLIASGIYLVTDLPIQLYPQTQRPRVRVVLTHDGISAVDFAGDYSDEIESRLLNMDGVDMLEVSYENNRSNFTLTFDWEIDPEDARSAVDSAMSSVNTLLPLRLRDSYRVGFFSGENAGYLIIGITAPSVSPEELYRTLDTSVRPLLNGVDDAESVDIYPVEELQVDVTLRPAALLSYGITILDVESAMRSEIQSSSVGSLGEGDASYLLRFRRGIQSVFDVGEIEITRVGSVSVRLQDVADISIQYTLPGRVFLMEGRRGIQITASPIDGGNVRQMSRDVAGILETARADGILPGDTVFQRYLDPADYIDRSVRNVVRAAVIGALLAMLVVLFGLGEIHNTILIGLSLPTTIVLSFILMSVFDVSLNLISLGGIALAVGMVIDSAIVVIENIHRFRMNERPIGDAGHLKDVILRAVEEVRVPVIASTVTSILVFLPISFTAPLTNAILGDQARTVVFALTISLVIALTLVPIMAFHMFRPRRKHPEETGKFTGLQKLSVPLMGAVRNGYMTLLRMLIRRRWRTFLFIGFSFALLAFSVVRILPLIPREIISPPLSDRVVVFFGSSSMTERDRIAEEVVPRIGDRIDQRVGEHVVDTYVDVMGRFNRYFLNLSSSAVAEEVVAELQEEFVSDNEWYYNVMMWDPAQLPLPRTMDLQISVHGDDPTEAISLLERIRDVVNQSELYGWAFTNPGTNFSDELTITSRQEVFQGFSDLSEESLLNLVRTSLGGTASIELDYQGGTIPVEARFPDDYLESRRSLENLLVPYRRGAIPLKHFFDFSVSTGVAGMASEDGEEIFRLYARMRPGTAAASRGEYEDTIRELLKAEVELPPGFSITFDNPQEEMDSAIRSLFVALVISVLLIYLLLAFQFNSPGIPLIILVTVPLGFIGVVLSLYLFNSTLSLNSMLGTILLGGIVVNNAIIMIDFYIRIRRIHDDRVEALVVTAGLRFIPIMMTMLTTVFGMLPIAVGMGEGANIVQPLGIAVSGGLVVSTLFTLFMVPAILSLVHIGEER
jgi:hydrophobic/amphiphilic exporter-1 (mainly G- bacteria), HAE1 family